MLENLINSRGLTVGKVAREINVDSSDLKHWIKKQNLDEMPNKVRKNLANFLDIPEGDIIREM